MMKSEGKVRRKRTAVRRAAAAALCLALVLMTACAGSGGESGAGAAGGKNAAGADSGKNSGKSSGQSTELSKGIKANPVSVSEKNPSATVAATDFGLQMFQSEIKDGENTLISPASVLFALGMTANGARGNTLTQLEDAFGMPVDELNAYLYAYRQSLPSEKNCKVTTANSIWFRQKDTLTVSPEFLQKNADYYAAGIYEAPFDDSTADAINEWVKENTDGMIDRILDQIPADAVMYLVNAMAFDAKWQEKYTKNQVWEAVFTTGDGTEQKVEFMHSDENKYMEDENAVGFLKYYEGGKYAFAAFLPKEGVTPESYAASLTGEKLNHMLMNPTTISVQAAIPKFEAEYSTELGAALKGMGVTDAFSGLTADFSGLGESEDGNIFINRVLHKTYICVDENGTKAAAVTAVEMVDECAMEEPDYKVVYLDRPFVYFLVDCEEGLPIFMGTVYTVE